MEVSNVRVGSLVSAGIVCVLAAGPVLLTVTTPRDAGANIGAGLLLILAVMVAAALGAWFTALRARRRDGGDPVKEGVGAGVVGVVLVVLVVGSMAALVTPLPLAAVPIVALELAVPAAAAAFLGAMVGGSWGPRRHGQP